MIDPAPDAPKPVDFLSSVLPTGWTGQRILNPRVLLLYGGYKIGKSALAAWLALNRKTLWMDYEQGNVEWPGLALDVIETVKKLQVANPKQTRIDFLFKLWDTLEKAPQLRYDFMVHDKLDSLEEWAERWATVAWKRTIIGKNFDGNSILELDMGLGYKLLQDKLKEIWVRCLGAAKHHVFLCSMKDKYIDKGDVGVSSADLDLTGKVRKIAVGQSDVIGYLFRAADGSNVVSFVTTEKGTFSGSRNSRLAGQRIKLSWLDEKGELQVDWDKIYQKEEA